MLCPKCGKESEGSKCPNCSSKKKNGLLIVCGIIIFAVAVCVVGTLYLSNKKTSSKDIFDKLISNTSNKLQSVMPSASDSISESYSIKLNLDLNRSIMSPEKYSFINDIELKGNTILNFKDKALLTKLSALYKEESLVDLTVYGNNDNIYASLGDLFSKYINVQVDKDTLDSIFDSYSKQNITNVKTILNEVELGIRKSLKEEYFKNEKETVTIDGKEVNVNKHTLILNEKNATILSRDILVHLNNDNFLNALSSISNDVNGVIEPSEDKCLDEEGMKCVPYSESTDPKESLKSTIDELNEKIDANNFSDSEKVYASVLTDSNNEFVGFSLSMVKENDKELTLVDVIKESKEKYSFELTNEENLKFCYGTLNINEKESNYEVYINDSTAGVGTIKVNIDASKGTTNTYNVTVTSPFVGTVKLIISSSSMKNADIDLPDFSNSVSYNELTEEDINSIFSKLAEKNAYKELLEKITQLMDTSK